MIILPIRINGLSHDFLLDTGAQSSVIINSISQELNLPENKQIILPVGAASGNKQELPFCIIQEIELGNNTLNKLPVMIMPDENLNIPIGNDQTYQIKGIIGWDILCKMNFSINISAKEIILNPSNSSISEIKNSLNSAFPTFMAKDQKGNNLLFGIDSGARNTWINKTSQIIENSNNIQNITHEERGFQGKYKKEELLLNEAKILLGNKEISFSNITTGFTDFIEGFHLDGVLGSDALRKGTAFFLMRANRFYFAD